MKKHTRKLLDKAIDTIEGAEILLTHEKTDLAAVAHIMPFSISPKLCLTKKGFNSKNTEK